MARQEALREQTSPALLRPIKRETLASPATLALCGMMAALIAVFSWISLPLPFSPVPLTLQTLGVLLAGGLLGRFAGSVSVLVFVLLGLAGLPVFHGGSSGPGVLAGPSGGFLLGFLVAAFIMGCAGEVARRRRGRAAVLVLVMGAVLASAAIYAAGVPWLALTTGMSLREALVAGLLPFLPGDAAKAAAAIALMRSVDLALVKQGLR